MKNQIEIVKEISDGMETIIMIIATMWQELKKDWKRWRSK